jgi:ferrochelatase
LPRGVLLVNLGSPASPTVADVRTYLDEFLMDPWVVDLPWPARRLLVSAAILPFRPKRSAAAYRAIWSEAGSPLVVQTIELARAVAARSGLPVAAAMRYGAPRIGSALAQLADAGGVDEVLLIALYPQHADSTVTTTIAAVRARMPATMKLTVLPPFFADPGYVECQTRLIARHLPERWDHLLLSFHGLPEAHLERADPTNSHCLARSDCCDEPSIAHATCYRHQCQATSHALAAGLGISRNRWSIAFQSRLGRQRWLEPATADRLRELPAAGVRDLVVACPAFVADNLETLEEIGMRGRAAFVAAGGERLTLVPCLNAQPDWVGVVAGWCTKDVVATPDQRQ